MASALISTAPSPQVLGGPEVRRPKGGGNERAEQVVGGPEGRRLQIKWLWTAIAAAAKTGKRKMTAAARGRRQPAGKPLGSRGGRLTPQRDGPPLEGRLGGRMFTIL